MSWDAYINGYIINYTQMGADGKPVHRWGGVSSSAAIFGKNNGQFQVWAASRDLSKFGGVIKVQTGGTLVEIIEMNNLGAFMDSKDGEVPQPGIFIGGKKYQGKLDL